MDSKQLLEKLCCAFGPSGCEYEVVQIIKEQVGAYADEMITDALGNLIIKINGKTDKRVMICAHTDEVGFMIRTADDEGCLYFHTVGGIDLGALCARRVTFLGKNGEKIKGVIDSKAIHCQSAKERGEYIPLENMHVNIGADGKQQALECLPVGSYGTFDSEFIEFGSGFIKAKALDDRAGCCVMCEVIKRIRENGITPENTLYFAFTVREEVGRSGAVTASERIKPDFALILECTAVADVPDVPPHKQVSHLSKGVSLSLMDHSTVYRKQVVQAMMDLAAKNGLKYQIKTLVSGGNDAGHIHKASGGVRCATLSIPSRYIHTACCVINMDDYYSAVDFAYAVALNDI